MLKRLYISNFALIGEMSVDFTEGLTVMTGETGAGKSIFLEAMSLALGSRADLGALRDKKKLCVVEAEFELVHEGLKTIFSENNLDYDTRVVLRREISPEGRSRSLLNDSVVNLSVLRQVSDLVIDIHSQHETLLLNASGFQMEMLDAFANSAAKHAEYGLAYKSLVQQKNQLAELMQRDQTAKKDFDYFSFLLKEFEGIDIKTGELEKLESESLSIEHSDSIKRNLLSAAQIIHGGEEHLLGALAKAKQQVQSISKFHDSYETLYGRLQAVYLELKDLGLELEQLESRVEVDRSKLDVINERIDKLSRLLNKHQVKTEEELLVLKESYEDKIGQLNSLTEEIAALTKQIAIGEKTCFGIAKQLSAMREAAIGSVETKTKDMLALLSMTNATFKIELQRRTTLDANGLDGIKFMFSANKGASLSELSKVASGGELSRLMLTLKALLATKKKLPSIIFDEIDSGVSGDVANKIGNILFEMGKQMQVIAITHLPQLASKGKRHLFVFKKDDDQNTQSFICYLEGEDRVQEIAKMLSAGKLTKTAISNAKELLETP